MPSERPKKYKKIRGIEKRCTHCLKIKPITEFYDHYHYKYSLCKSCESIYGKKKEKKRKIFRMATAARWYRNHKKSRLEYIKKWRDSDIGKEYRRKEYQRNIVKHKARIELRKAVKSGLIIKRPCVICGIDKTEAHHEDYSKPLQVIWLCRNDHFIFEKVKRILSPQRY